MAVKIYKDGKSELCEPEYLDSQLSAGWSVTQENTESDAESPVIDEMNIAELRALGVSLGIENAETMHHATLKKTLKDR